MRSPSPIVFFLVASLIVAALATVALVGSRPAVPPPFGIARNGTLAVIQAGVLRIDGRPVGPDGIRSTVFSPDGRSIAYVVAAPSGVQFGVLDVASGETRYTDPDAFQLPDFAISWSPDGSMIARESGTADGNGNHTSTVTLVRLADGTKRTLDTGFPIAEVAWRPPDGRELLVRGWKDERAGLYLIRVDDGRVRPVLIASDGLDDLGQGAWSPEGTRIAYVYATARPRAQMSRPACTSSILTGRTMSSRRRRSGSRTTGRSGRRTGRASPCPSTRSMGANGPPSSRSAALSERPSREGRCRPI